MGSIFIQTNRLDSAKVYLDKYSGYIFEIQDTADFINAYQLQGELAVASNKYVSALDYYLKAIEWSDHAVIPMRKADVLQKMASIYVALEDDDNAKKYIEMALEIAIENDYKTMQNSLRTRLAHYELRDNNFDKVEEYLTNAAPYF